jgi:hypothetical protein
MYLILNTCSGLSSPVSGSISPYRKTQQWFCACVLIGISLFAASARPFVLTVVTDDAEERPVQRDVANRGFNLMYRQIPCD